MDSSSIFFGFKWLVEALCGQRLYCLLFGHMGLYTLNPYGSYPWSTCIEPLNEHGPSGLYSILAEPENSQQHVLPAQRLCQQSPELDNRRTIALM